ncbi:MAG: penicillin-binding protein 2 [Verrucomicrobiales bacterium]
MVTRYLFRLYLFALLLVAGFGALLWRLWVVQIENKQKYVAALPRAGTVVQRLPGVRGEIKDRNGVPLAVNRMSYEIKLDLREVERLYKRRHKEIPMSSYAAPDRYGTMRQRDEPDIFKMYDDEVKPQLERLSLAIGVNSDDMRRHWRTNRGVIPYTYRKEIPFEHLAVVAEHGSFLDGVTISQRPLRKYPYGAMMGHILGYVKQIGDLEVPSDEGGQYDFYEGDDIGMEGIERTMDRTLRGRAGRRVYPKDEHGKIIYEELTEERMTPIKGSDVYLTIDIRLQYIAETALRDAGVGRGAAVVMDPATGEVLAMASVPSFDPGNFIPEIDPDQWKAYVEDETEVLMNRALLSYAPGSTFKIPIALAGCVAGVSDQFFTCDGTVLIGNRNFKCWTVDKRIGGHGTMLLSDAIMHSCNCFFYQYGIATGIKTIDTVCHWFGLGEPTGIDLPREASGRVPNEKLFALSTGFRWTVAQTANTSIGQGQVEATPLQMCNVAATVANHGVCYKPKLILKIHDHADKMDIGFPDRPRYDLQKEGAKTKSIELVRKGMLRVVHGDRGTAKAARANGYETAGKTGTAQTSKINPQSKNKENDTWFIAFAPYDKPRYAVCVFVENGTSGGGTSAPIAARIIKQGLAMEAGNYRPPVQSLAEAKGHFKKLESVVYDDDPVEAALAAQHGNENENVTASEPPSKLTNVKARDRRLAAPKLKRKANAEGSNVRNQSPPRLPEAPRRGFFRRLLNFGQ